MPKTDVLIFVEDPGAANYVAQLPTALMERGRHPVLLAAGSAREYLHTRGIPAEPVPRTATAKKILATFRPRLVLVGTAENPDTLGLTLITQARAAAIESIGVVDFQANADYRFRGRSHAALTYAPDWLLLPDAWMKAPYIALGYPPERAIVCGHPHYDHIVALATELSHVHRAILRRRVLPQAPPNRPVVIFLAEISSTGFNPSQYQRSAEYTLSGRGTSSGRTEVVLEEFLDAIALVQPRPYLVLRLHPKNTLEEFGPYVEMFDAVSCGGSPYELVYTADLIVGMTTMLLFEAVLMGRPTLSIVPRAAEKAWLPSIRAGVTPCVTTRQALHEALCASVLAGKQQPPPLASEVCVSGALQRAVAFIEQRLQSTLGTKAFEAKSA